MVDASTIPRCRTPGRAEDRVRAALADTRVVLVSGARQAGKSTLVRICAPDGARSVVLDNLAERNAVAADPVEFIRTDRAPVIDEVQRVPQRHYRTKDGIEVDAILEDRQGRTVGIEVKARSTVSDRDFNGLRHLAARLGPDFVRGLVLYTGPRTLPFAPNLRAVPISALWELDTLRQPS